jgi:hypothetical protein
MNVAAAIISCWEGERTPPAAGGIIIHSSAPKTATPGRGSKTFLVGMEKRADALHSLFFSSSSSQLRQPFGILIMPSRKFVLLFSNRKSQTLATAY